MKTPLLLAGFLSVLFFSCTRENNSTQDKPKTLDSIQLTMIVDSQFRGNAFVNADSNLFSYDAAGRLIEWRYTSYADTTFFGQDYSITRDEQGRATKIYTKYSETGVGGPVSPNIINEIHYSNSSDQASFLYQYTEGQSPSSGDSLVLSYTGRNITDTRYFDLSGATPKGKFNETVWVFDNTGHLTSSIANAEDSSQPIYYTYEFDSKINPIELGVEALCTDPNRMSFGNILHININWPLGQIFGDDYYVYTYRSDGRPIRCVYTNPVTAPSIRTSTFIYSR